MRTGDTVLHKPSGQRWLVAYVEGEYMAWCGWPDGEARTADCEVVRECSNAEHISPLMEIAGANAGRRTRKAIEALAEIAKIPDDPIWICVDLAAEDYPK